MPEAALADERNGCGERAHGVAQQYLVDREVDMGLHASKCWTKLGLESDYAHVFYIPLLW